MNEVQTYRPMNLGSRHLPNSRILSVSPGVISMIMDMAMAPKRLLKYRRLGDNYGVGPAAEEEERTTVEREGGVGGEEKL